MFLSHLNFGGFVELIGLLLLVSHTIFEIFTSFYIVLFFFFSNDVGILGG